MYYCKTRNYIPIMGNISTINVVDQEIEIIINLHLPSFLPPPRIKKTCGDNKYRSCRQADAISGNAFVLLAVQTMMVQRPQNS